MSDDDPFDGSADDPILQQIAVEWGEPGLIHDPEWRSVVVDTVLYVARRADRSTRLLLHPAADRAAAHFRRRMARMLPSIFPEDRP